MRKFTNEERQLVISKRHITMVRKFNQELESFAKETGDSEAELFEDINTSFRLSNVRVEDGYLKYRYDGREEADDQVSYDEEEDTIYEGAFCWADSIPETIKFWRSCLRRAKRYWSMSTESLDAIYNGDREDIED